MSDTNMMLSQMNMNFGYYYQVYTRVEWCNLSI